MVVGGGGVGCCGVICGVDGVFGGGGVVMFVGFGVIIGSVAGVVVISFSSVV